MIDPDEIEAYNEWKAIRLAGSQDLSIEAYNTEMGVQANAWEMGVKALTKEIGVNVEPDRLADFIATQNPFRKPGMRGHTP